MDVLAILLDSGELLAVKQFDFYFIFSVEFDSYDEFLVVNGISKLIRSTYVVKRITLFHPHALVYSTTLRSSNEELVISGVEPKVAVATNINPKLVGELVTTRLVSVGSVPEIKCRRGKKAFLLHSISPESINLFLPYCNEDSKIINVYEYREKGTLKDHRNDSDNPRLSWRQKLEICAKGLHYLHTGSARATIHFVIEALDPNHKLGTGTTRSKLNLNRKTTSYHQTVP
ncbi:hypothetical protein IGI04_029526 [Brassica rapa subsp. trilocularis]|uniref:Serine-threonine/tyrosine-protein kinase catalytic domain-containing protein n=1 Tax=Brassica rapa subsp. trilocularis TaxID=1813537 RepID=A0ABQ7LQV6_BRACM|nr:hypothetical protein IGI04_029526 [Brassica rapa subsp. trilocularis]